jgi:excisionase family DNA binding protein
MGSVVQTHVVERTMSANLETSPPERRVATVDETAVILRLSRGATYEGIRRKEIPSVRVGRRLLVPVAALERMLTGNPGVCP